MNNKESKVRCRVSPFSNLLYTAPLTVRIGKHYQQILNLLNYDSVELQSVAGPQVWFATIEFSEYLVGDTVDVSADLLSNMGISKNSEITISPANMLAELQKVDIVLNTRTPLRPSQLLERYLLKPITRGLQLLYKNVKFIVINLTDIQGKDQSAGLITKQTVFNFVDHVNYATITAFSELGGLNEELSKMRDLIDLPLTYSDLFERLKIRPPRGILLYGPPGTGKTSLARAIASATNANFVLINAPEIAQKYFGDSEAKLREIFAKATAGNKPAIIFIDEADAIAVNRANTTAETDQRIVAQLLVLIDGLQKRKERSVIIFATNLPDKLDPAFRRGGRLDIQIELKPPNETARVEIFKAILRNTPKVDINYQYLASITNGFVGADIASLVKQAGIICVKEYIKNVTDRLQLTMAHFTLALRSIEPSTLREFKVSKPNVPLSSVIGLDDTIKEIKNNLVYPIKYKEVYKRHFVEPIKGILLYGPPGTGKTLLAKAIATELNYQLIVINGPQLLDKYVGGTEAAIRSVFRKARYSAPAIIIVDELDAFMTDRTKTDEGAHNTHVLGQFLVELSGIGDDTSIVLIGTTNRPDLLDAALLRSGRFDLKLHIDYPKIPSLVNLIKHYATRSYVQLSETSVLQFATRAYEAKLTGADIVTIHKNALKLAIEDMELKGLEVTSDLVISEQYFRQAFNKLIETTSSSYKDEKTSYHELN